MKKYALISEPGVEHTEDFPVGKWADGSIMTLGEAMATNQPVAKEYMLISDMKGARVAEVFELTTRFALAFASAGVKPNLKDCFELAAEMYSIKDKL